MLFTLLTILSQQPEAMYVAFFWTNPSSSFPCAGCEILGDLRELVLYFFLLSPAQVGALYCLTMNKNGSFLLDILVQHKKKMQLRVISLRPRLSSNPGWILAFDPPPWEAENRWGQSAQGKQRPLCLLTPQDSSFQLPSPRAGPYPWPLLYYRKP